MGHLVGAQEVLVESRAFAERREMGTLLLGRDVEHGVSGGVWMAESCPSKC